MLKLLQSLSCQASFELSSISKHTPKQGIVRASGLMLALLAVTVGCGDADRARIVGRWEISSDDRVLERIDNATTPEDGSVDIEDSAAPLPPRMVVQFAQYGALETQTRISNSISEKNGTWSFVSFDPAARTAVVECELMGQTTEHELIFDGDNIVRMVPPNMAGTTKKLKFVRK